MDTQNTPTNNRALFHKTYRKMHRKTHQFMHSTFIALKTGDLLDLPIEVNQHIRVLRLKVGDHLTLLDGQGGVAQACLEQVSHKHSTVQILDCQCASPPKYHDILVQAVSGMDKMDWVIEKATELGIAEIYPVITERSQTRLDINSDPERALKKQQHWQSVANAACEQSGNLWLPKIAPAQSLSTVLQILQTKTHTNTNKAVQYIFDTQEHPSFISSDIGLSWKTIESVHIAIGPEGGFSTEEIAQFSALAWQTRSLGDLVLRTETAPVVALSQLTLWRLLHNKS